MLKRFSIGKLLSFLAIAFLFVDNAHAFIFGNPNTIPWRRSASGVRDGNGSPGTLTWSIVPDGTSVDDGFQDLGGSDLIEFLNENFDGDPNEADHTQQPWFSIFEESVGRWDELSGLSLVYEPNDDGGNDRTRRGILGTRGDIRISGASIDGANGVLAFNFFPDSGGDMTIDTDDIGFATSTRNDFRFFRNTIMHELGHGFGLGHVVSDTDRLLLEPFTDNAIDGPQLDEIRAIQFFWGDAFEETNDGLGNQTFDLATPLGSLGANLPPLVVGADADGSSQRVRADETDFVSISNEEDIDFFSFNITTNASLTAELTPHGGEFDQSGEGGTPTFFDANARSDLALTIFDTDGTTILDFADDTAAGESELLEGIELVPGEYFASISGAENTVQLYSLDLSIVPLLTENLRPGDYNLDGIVDAADFTVWRDLLDVPIADALAADGNLDGDVDEEDYQIWLDNFGNVYPNDGNVAAVPEPNANAMFLAAVILFSRWRRRRRCP